MTAGWRSYVVFAVAVMAILACVPPTAGGEKPESNPLSAFEPFIGSWEMQGSIQRVEWGVGKLSVKSTSHVVQGGKKTTVSEGMWYVHPATGEIKGIFTAVGMPVEFFDYTTTFEDNRMVSRLEAYTSSGAKQTYEEVWALGEGRYDWSLWQGEGEGRQKIMDGVFTRVAND